MPPTPQPNRPQTCAFKKPNGNFCKRPASGRDKYCWQHAPWSWHRIGALLRRRQTIVGIIITGVALVIGHYWPSKPTPVFVTTEEGDVFQKAPQSEFERELSRSANSLKTVAKEYFSAAENDFAAQNYGSAAQNYANSIAEIPTLSAYLNEGLVYLDLSDRTNAETAFQKGLQLSRDQQDKGFEIGFRDNLGLIYLHEGKPKLAMETLKQALEASLQLGSPPGQAFAQTYLGELYERQGKFDDAISTLQDARDASTDPRLADIHLRAIGLLAISHLGRNGRGDVDLAQQILEEQFCPKTAQLGLHLAHAMCLDNLGAIALTQKKYEDASKSFSSAYALYKQYGSQDGQAASLDFTAEECIAFGKLAEALNDSKEAYDLYVKTGEPHGQANSLINMADVREAEHNSPEALRLLQQALPLAEQTGDSPMKAGILQLVESIKRDEGAASENRPVAAEN